MKFPYLKFPNPRDPQKPFVARPLIPVYLLRAQTRTRSPYYALLDSGADGVIFPAELAIEVGILDFKTGHPEPTMGFAGQRTEIYHHDLTLQILGDSKTLPIRVGFAAEVAMPLLGRSFFKHFKTVLFAEGRCEVELRPGTEQAR